MKVICDVCGTTFPETATHCPICGCAKSPTAQTISADDVQPGSGTTSNTYPKGGRFAKSNVKRSSSTRSQAPRKNDSQGSNKGLIAVVIILLLAVLMVTVYIGVKMLGSTGNDDNSNGGNQNITGDQNPEPSQPDASVPCTSVKLSVKVHEFTEESEQLLLTAIVEPNNTTEPVIFTSSDTKVATVDGKGLVKPGTHKGEAVITARCGNFTAECKIFSQVGADPEPVQPSQPVDPTPDIPSNFVLKLNRDDFTLSKEGEVWNLLQGIDVGTVSPADITWESSDTAVVTVEDGKVKGVNRGKATITATIGDQVATCIVRCSFDAAPPSDVEALYEISHKDVTIGVGETFNLSLKSIETGANVQGIEWQVSKEGYVDINGNKIKGVQPTGKLLIEVFVEYEGVTYKCIVRVKSN